MAESPPPTTRSGLPKWLKVTTITLLVVANLAVLALIWVIQTGNNLFSSAATDEKVSDVLDESSGDQLTFLIVGSDSRAGLDDLTNFGVASGARGDVVMLVRLDKTTSSAQMLSIPRDYYVEIPGHGQTKINAAYAYGGPSLMVETIKSNFDVEINHYVEIDFVGFEALVDRVGGIEITFPYPARDSKSGLDVDAGTQLLDGSQALAYARSRHYQELQGGSWVSVKANDFGRSERQQEVIRALLSRLKTPGSIAEAGDIASAMSQNMTIDSNLAETSVGSLIWDFKGILTGSIEGATLPGDVKTINGSSVVVASEPEAGTMLANFRAGKTLAAHPIRVEVLNGNGAAGAAGEMSRKLEDLGFRVDSIGNADSTSYGQTTVIVPDGSTDGDEITSALGFGVVRFGTVDNGIDAVVIVGADAA
jgi:LCP family protein required for cell wall assembly